MHQLPIIVCLAVLLCGCADMPAAEVAWQSMHVIDVAQTLKGPVRDPCYREVGLVTSRVIGHRPKAAELIAWSAAYGIAHYFVWQWIDQSELPKGWKIALRTIDLGNKGYVIANNYRQGVRVFGDNKYKCTP